MPDNPFLKPAGQAPQNPFLTGQTQGQPKNPFLTGNPFLDRPKNAGKIYSGNLLSDVADTLSVPSYALAGLLQGKGVVKGVQNRANWVDYLAEQSPGMNKPFAKVGKFQLTPSNTIGTALNVILDPSWLIPPAKIGKAIGAGAKALGVTEAAAKALEGSRLAAQAEKFTIPALGVGLKPSTRAALKTFGEITDKSVMQESRLLEPALNVAREINKLTPGAQDLVAKYIEAGVDLEDAVRAAGFASADEARAAAKAAGGSEFFRGEMVPTEVPGTKKNIVKMRDIQDVVGQTNEDIVARQQRYLEQHEAQKASLLAQAAELEKGVEVYSNGYPKTKEGSAALYKAYQIRQHVRDIVDRDIQHNRSIIDEYKQKIADAAEEARIAQENNDLLYLTTQPETAQSYAQGSTLPDILTTGKPEGYKPTVYTYKGVPGKVLDMTKYGKGGIMSEEEAHTLLREIGLTEAQSNEILGRTVYLTSDEFPIVQSFRLFRGKNLPPIRKALTEAGYDTVHYAESKQDNWIFLNRSKVARAEDVAKLEQLPEAVRNRLLPPAVPTLAKDATAAAKQEAARAARAAQTATERMSRKEVLALAKSKGLNPQLIQSLAERAMEADAAVGRALVDAGVISEDTFKAWEGQHLRRVYQRYEDTMRYVEELRKTDPAAAAQLESTLKNMGAVVTGTKSPSIRPKIPSGAAAARKDLTQAERQALGEITQAGYRLAKGAQVGAAGASKANMLKDIAQEFGATEFRPGYLQMPEGKLWGDLSGKWVPDYIHSQLNEWVRRPSEFEKVSRKLWSYWKFGKTVANPATHARNMLSNLLLADNAGLSPARLDIYAEALADLSRNGKWIQEAKNAGTAFVDTFAGRELPQFLETLHKTPGNLWQKTGNALSKAGAKLGDAYQFEEQWGKLAIYIFKRKQGLAPEAAAKAAEDWLFNYRKVPRWIDNLRSGKLGPVTIPFATFSYKAIPAYAKAIYYNPARVARWFKYAQGAERSVVISPERLAAEGKAQPDWMKKGMFLRLPIEDEHGRALYLDLNYIVPFNDAFQLSGLWGPGGAPAFASMPLMDLIQDYQRNQSRFTGRPIWKDGALPQQKREAAAKYLKDFLLPPLAGGYSFDKVKESIMKTPDWKGRTTRLDVTLANVLLGLKARPMDPNEELGFRFKEVQDQLNALRSNLRSVAADPKLSQREKDHLWQQGIDAMNRLVQEATELGEASKALR